MCVEKAAGPYIEERKSRLLAEGIKYSFVSSQGLTGGILNILDDRAEFKAKTGKTEIIFFRNVRSVVASLGMLELPLTDGTSKAFTVDNDISAEVAAFVEEAVKNEITEEYPVESIVKCEQTESSESENILSDVLSGGISLWE